MALASAGGAAVLRAAQKDDYFVGQLAARASDLLRLVAGNRAWSRHERHVPNVSRFAYSALTTLADLQTLGEEYAAILQVDATYTRLPAKLYQLIYAILSAFGEGLARRALDKISGDTKRNDALRPRAKRLLLNSLALLKWTLPLMADVHRALFYLGANHYEVSKRIAGINYVNAAPGEAFAYALGPLGVPCLARALLQAVNSPPAFAQDYEELPTEDSEERGKRCPGCLESNATPCALPCGHVVCDRCARGSHACALCRAPYHPNRTVPLQNVSFRV